VLYSHRSTVLHTFCICARDVLAIASCDSILAIVPFFRQSHSGSTLCADANAWGVPYAGCMVGAKLVLPGVALDGKSVCDMIMQEKVTFSFAVPTVFLGLFEYLDKAGIESLGTLQRVTIGGGQLPHTHA
jgi:hypothetical protein